MIIDKKYRLKFLIKQNLDDFQYLLQETETDYIDLDFYFYCKFDVSQT
ncbi:hypothetical protein RCZ15_13630 [Capnocytophaga catalasegens]|uniref:Uncharacterized protein n=1 Tax=Capnocytophaga catalasegens TaxID=1004260 RepID=A0AAV5AXA6_9FLAO|nr:hypothetical protein RCZ03_02110 [Capnocytophaga catalasegens]GJM50390.1 hypothetical protein RCZ15_13630 [Capnocytophaga catalasegens]GJM52673.1 hypothetical protein RCZ16_09900 [Capnocytophaga catalasegens]